MSETGGRSNQKRRTRKHLLEAASRLMRQGRKPSLDEVAEEALVSRATAYRYFPSIDQLLVEAAVDVAFPAMSELFKDAPAEDPIARLERADAVLDEMLLANEGPLRLMLAQSLERGLRADSADIPPRQNRRTPMIEAALQPAKGEFTPGSQKLLSQALALILGTEAMIVFKDVLQVDAAEARKVKRWAIRALVEAARKR